MRVGIIGVGSMGVGIGLNLLKAGYNLTALKHKNKKNVNFLKENGAEVTESLKEIGKKCEMIILCLPSSQDVEEVTIKKNGLIDFLEKGSVIFDCTTSNPESTKEIHKKFLNEGIYFLDAPLNRSPKEALEGRLNILIGGDEIIVNKYKKVLESFSENIQYVGGIGKAHKLKLVNNFISMSFTAIIISAISNAETNDINLDDLHNVMEKGSNYIPSLKLMIDWVEQGGNTLQFSLKNALKDLNYYEKLVQNNVDMELVNLFIKIYSEASDIYPNGDLPNLYNYFKGA